MAGVCIWNLVQLRATTEAVSYLDDASMHQQMVRAATAALRRGQLPLTQWFPYLNGGSPHFLHYQSGGAILTGAAGLVVGPNVAFRWSLYLLVALWPVAVYASARIWGLSRPAAAAAALAASFLSSVPGVGYEQKAYLWVGYGLWAQLWASWALPFAWAATWRALSDRRWSIVAVAAITATAAFHFETAYLAFAAVLLLPFAAPRTRSRYTTAALIGGASLVTTAWVTVPLIAQGRWAAVNQALGATGLVRGYGARQDLLWLVSGRTFDAGRLPVVTVAVVLGLVWIALDRRRVPQGPGLAALFVASLLLSFGPTTWGPLADIVPGHTDLFFRRFLMGVHLSGLYLAGIGVIGAWERLRPLVTRAVPPAWRARDPRLPQKVGWAAAAVLGAVCMLPLLDQFASYDAGNSALIHTQASAEAGSADLDAVLARVAADPVGRVYAGAPGTWGDQFRLGFVPVYKYLEQRDVDEIGYTLRTAALLSEPEDHFDEHDPEDYVLFGIHYLILPTGKAPPVPADLVMVSGGYTLWGVPGAGYLSVADAVGTMATNRRTVGTDSVPVLTPGLLGAHQVLRTLWDLHRTPAIVVDRSARTTTGNPGVVVAQSTDLVLGRATAGVHLERAAYVVLAASYDPGWRATVDGRPAPTVMIAPALVGVQVGPGTHHVVLTYRGFAWYPLLFALALAGFVAVALVVRRRRPDGAGRRSSDGPGPPTP